MTTLPHNETSSVPTKPAICPKCGEAGFVHARIDAYANRLVLANGDIDRSSPPDVTEFDEIVYECFHCFQELELAEIEKVNRGPR